MPFRSRLSPFRVGGAAFVAAAYALLSTGWILFSDRLVSALAPNAEILTEMQSAKDILFVVVSALLLFLLVRYGEQAVEARSNYYRTLFANSPLPILLVRPDSLVIEDCNDAAGALYGYPLARLRKMKLDALAAPIEGDPEASPPRPGITGRQLHRTAEGQEITVDLSSQRIAIRRQERLLLQIQDITRQLSIERERVQAQRDFQEALSSPLFMLFRYNIARDSFDYVSPHIEAITGLSVAQLCEPGGAARLRERIHPDDLATLIISSSAPTQPDANGTAHVDGEFRILDRSGEYRWLHTAKTILFGGEGGQIAVVGAAIDVNVSRADRERMRVTLRSIADGVVTADAQGRITLINPIAARMLGLTEEEVVGQLLSRVVQLSPPLFHATPDDADHRVAVLPDARLRRRHQDALPVSCSLAPIRNEGDRGSLGYVLVIHDRSEDLATHARLDAEEAQRRDTQERYALALEGTNEGLWDWKPISDELLLSSRLLELLGVNRQHLMTSSRDWLQRIHPDERAHFREQLIAHLKGHTPFFQSEYRVRTEQGLYLWIQARGLALREPGGRAYRMVGSLGDISERKEHEKALQHLNQQLEQRVAERTRQLEAAVHELESFSYSVSHDLRAPLRAIDGYSAILASDYGNALDDEAHELFTRMRSAVQRMGRLIDDMLRLSRVTRQPLERKTTDISALARGIAQELQQRDPSRPVLLEIEDGLEANADPSLIGVALQNLFENAWKFSARQEHPELHFLRVRAPEGGFAYLVEDNGAGFDMRYRDKLFAPFQRLHHDRDFPGSGVGLATVARIIHRHGGRVWADGTPGHGARFYFTLEGSGEELPEPAEAQPESAQPTADTLT